ncbi:response regulator [Pseudozobellia thermophila]|uniref:CheY chemotaxis protein or a CheY-like REC (Receiver) domain n=1 Tax=Pseudozobellia thermophila TaxID=192903 RepID=A0A1M6G0D4_9FLAO|nr:response regulator [Pseudozobellia thermophila]SHJ03396.1 CheY chemotaxis protein or a CheY-like REC (receiver) domain [Pseudozobellia thermophila]
MDSISPNVQTVYLVDDDREDQELFSEALELADSHVDLKIFDNGVDLMADLYSGRPLPDLVFLDLYMPLMNGEECLRDIRENEKFDKVPLIIYSTLLDRAKIEHLFSIGANRYLHKPSSFKSLVYALERTMNSVRRNKLGGTAIINIVG